LAEQVEDRGRRGPGGSRGRVVDATDSKSVAYWERSVATASLYAIPPLTFLRSTSFSLRIR